jgi:hypothetical protein
VLQSAEGEALPSFSLHLWQQVCVANSTMRTIGGEYGRTYMSADFCSAEDACFARALMSLE